MVGLGTRLEIGQSQDGLVLAFQMVLDGSRLPDGSSVPDVCSFSSRYVADFEDSKS